MIVLITPTGGRPKQFELCMRWMKNQTYSGRVFWIVIDDCIPVTTNALDDNFRENWTIIKKYPVPIWQPGMNTQSRNLIVAVNLIHQFPRSWIDGIFIIEDDDYYTPEYLDEMVNKLHGYDVIGQGNTVYYNVPKQGFKINNNVNHSSLFQTGFTIDALPIFESCFSSRFIDIAFFQTTLNKNVFIQEKQLAVGIKGLLGRNGIGMGHRMRNPKLDYKYNVLKALLGDDYKYYI